MKVLYYFFQISWLGVSTVLSNNLLVVQEMKHFVMLKEQVADTQTKLDKEESQRAKLQLQFDMLEHHSAQINEVSVFLHSMILNVCFSFNSFSTLMMMCSMAMIEFI